MSSAERDTARIDAEIWRRNHDSACRERDAAIERAERAELRYRNLEANMIASHAARDSDVKYMLAECDKRDAMIRELVELVWKYKDHYNVPPEEIVEALITRATEMVETI